jgi:hypothetical protein
LSDLSIESDSHRRCTSIMLVSSSWPIIQIPQEVQAHRNSALLCAWSMYRRRHPTGTCLQRKATGWPINEAARTNPVSRAVQTDWTHRAVLAMQCFGGSVKWKNYACRLFEFSALFLTPNISIVSESRFSRSEVSVCTVYEWCCDALRVCSWTFFCALCCIRTIQVYSVIKCVNSPTWSFCID